MHSDYDLWHIVEVVLPLPLKGEGSGKLSWGGDDVHCVTESQYLLQNLHFLQKVELICLLQWQHLSQSLLLRLLLLVEQCDVKIKMLRRDGLHCIVGQGLHAEFTTLFHSQWKCTLLVILVVPSAQEQELENCISNK